MNNYKRQVYCQDDNTSPEPLDTGETFEAKDIDDALALTMLTVKPQVRRYVAKNILDYDCAYIEYFPSPSKNKTGYSETIYITLEDDDSERVRYKCLRVGNIRGG